MYTCIDELIFTELLSESAQKQIRAYYSRCGTIQINSTFDLAFNYYLVSLLSTLYA